MKNDATYIAIILGLFVLAFGLVAACDRIIGSDDDDLTSEGTTEPEAAADQQVAA